MPKRIIATFAPGKPVEIRTEGFAGKACQAASKPYEQLVQGRVLSDTPTPEMAATATVAQTVPLKGS